MRASAYFSLLAGNWKRKQVSNAVQNISLNLRIETRLENKRLQVSKFKIIASNSLKRFSISYSILKEFFYAFQFHQLIQFILKNVNSISDQNLIFFRFRHLRRKSHLFEEPNGISSGQAADIDENCSDAIQRVKIFDFLPQPESSLQWQADRGCQRRLQKKILHWKDSSWTRRIVRRQSKEGKIQCWNFYFQRRHGIENQRTFRNDFHADSNRKAFTAGIDRSGDRLLAGTSQNTWRWVDQQR